MNILDLWAMQWGVPAAAIQDLRARYVAETASGTGTNMPRDSEAYVQSECRLFAPRNDMLLFRNNVGVLPNDNGQPVRFGLANDTKELNKRIKSGDLLGIRRVPITQAMVGTVIGQFASVECKHRYWHPGEDVAREGPQKEWANLVASWGGHARITSSAQGML